MAELITWARIEPHAKTTDIDVGLAAEVADPLWMLARQYQLGEFTGDDGGSPISIEVRASYARLSRYRPGRLPPDEAVEGFKPYDPSKAPLESMVEAEPIDASSAWWVSVQSGQQLEQILRAKDKELRTEDLSKAIGPLRRSFGFDANTGGRKVHILEPGDTRFVRGEQVESQRAIQENERALSAGKRTAKYQPWPSGAAERRHRAVLAGRVIDGVKLWRSVKADGGLPNDIVAGVTNARTLQDIVEKWHKRWTRVMPVVRQTTARETSWQPQRLEYAFSVAAPDLDGGEVVLHAAEYDGSGIDWHHLDIAPGVITGAAADTKHLGHIRRRFLPKPVSFPGMPADRFWEMEDGHIALGSLDAVPTDIVRILAVEFAVVYGPDWFVIPLELPVGSLARVDWVIVRDTFGAATLVGTAKTQQADLAGRQYQLSTLREQDADLPYLFVPPASLYGQQSSPLEEILIQRDELANMAWIIERSALGPAGRAIALDSRKPEAGPARKTAAELKADLIYQVATSVPPNWVPLVAVPLENADPPRLMLERASLLDPGTVTAHGSIGQMASEIDLVHEEEVTRAGVRLTMLDQLVRWVDGSTHLWRGRRKTPGLGESESRLFFDFTNGQR